MLARCSSAFVCTSIMGWLQKRFLQSREMGALRVLDSENTFGSENRELGTILIGNDHALAKFSQAQPHLSSKTARAREGDWV